MATPPLVVDLDGTLIHTDLLHESLLKIFAKHPLKMLQVPFWLLRGKGALKRRLAVAVSPDVGLLPYNNALLHWLRQQRSQGRELILCTASDLKLATAVAEHLGIFDHVMASEGDSNLKGEAKARALNQRFGHGNFDYVGDSSADLSVWRQARRAIIVNPKAGLVKRVKDSCEVEKVFQPPSRGVVVWRRLLRLQLWLKNLLLFVPMLAAHQLTSLDTWLQLFLAFLSFGVSASSIYIVNDLLDLESDRQHPRKRYRPLAAGLVSFKLALLLVPLLLVGGLLLGTLVNGPFNQWLLLYLLITCLYSLGIKRLVLIDCLTLAFLHTLRIVTGAAAAEIALSFWLLAFSVFIFLSLAFIKRYTELKVQQTNNKTKAAGRGYYTADAPMVQMLGITSGFAAVLVLALYLNSEAVVRLYRNPYAVWGAVPVLLFWVNWMWLQAHRDNMHDDPLVFAVKDKVSLLAGGAFAIVMILGTVDWPWS